MLITSYSRGYGSTYPVGYAGSFGDVGEGIIIPPVLTLGFNIWQSFNQYGGT